MAIISRYITGNPRRVTLVLDGDTLRDLDQIAPDNIGEAVRFCIQQALAAGAVFKATTQHTAAQCRKHQQRYPDNAPPLPTTYAGQVMTVKPVQVATPAPAIPATVEAFIDTWPAQARREVVNSVAQGDYADYLMHGDDEDDTPAQAAPETLAPVVIRNQPLSAAALAAVAAIALTDEEIRALDPARGGARPFVG